MDELEREWPNFSSIDFTADDLRGQPIKFTMIRYLSSLGVKKDSAGLNTISATDVAFIEKGYTNYKYTSKWGISRRIAQMFWQVGAYQYHGSSNHSSLLMRWVYFKVGLDIMLNNPVLGVGTGDMRLAYRSAMSSASSGGWWGWGRSNWSESGNDLYPSGEVDSGVAWGVGGYGGEIRPGRGVGHKASGSWWATGGTNVRSTGGHGSGSGKGRHGGSFCWARLEGRAQGYINESTRATPATSTRERGGKRCAGVGGSY